MFYFIELMYWLISTFCPYSTKTKESVGDFQEQKRVSFQLLFKD